MKLPKFTRPQTKYDASLGLPLNANKNEPLAYPRANEYVACQTKPWHGTRMQAKHSILVSTNPTATVAFTRYTS
jgi:hypothetical protein